MNMFLGAQFTYCEFCRENLISRALGSVFFCKDGLCRIKNETQKYTSYGGESVRSPGLLLFLTGKLSNFLPPHNRLIDCLTHHKDRSRL